MKNKFLSGLFALCLLVLGGRVQAQSYDKIQYDVRKSLEQAAEKQAIGFEPGLSDSLSRLYLGMVQQLDKVQADTQAMARLADTTRMLKVFEKYTKALAREKRFVPDIRRLAFKQLGLKRSSRVIQEESFEIKLINEYPRVHFTRYRDYSEAQVYVDSRRLGLLDEFKNGLILGSNRDFLVELRTAEGLLCSQMVRLKKGEVFDFSCEP